LKSVIHAAFVKEVLPQDGFPTIPTLNPITIHSIACLPILILKDKHFTLKTFRNIPLVDLDIA